LPDPVVPERWRLDLAGLAQYRLEKMGVMEVEQSQQCTVTKPKQFFSYRRDRQTGRMATLAWLSSIGFP
jgi:copper oxidase (laccase) domain-containing protein